MTIAELKQLIAHSAEQQRVFKNPTSGFEEYIEAGQRLIRSKQLINKLVKSGTLDIDVEVLKNNVKLFLDSQTLIIPSDIAKKRYMDNLIIYENNDEINLSYISLLKIVPSYLHYSPQDKIELLRDYPSAIDVIYHSLQQTITARKTNEQEINF